jgi:hypothetical protein
MTVAELIKELEKIPKDADILILTENENTFAQTIQFNDIANEVIITD